MLLDKLYAPQRSSGHKTEKDCAADKQHKLGKRRFFFILLRGRCLRLFQMLNIGIIFRESGLFHVNGGLIRQRHILPIGCLLVLGIPGCRCLSVRNGLAVHRRLSVHHSLNFTALFHHSSLTANP